LNKDNAWVIICGNYINALNIVNSLRHIGWKGKIVCLKDRENELVLVDLIKDLCEVWVIDITSPSDILIELAKRIPEDDAKFIFFTDERFMSAFQLDMSSPTVKNASFFIGSESHLETILDRGSFYKFLHDNNLASVPVTISSSEDPWERFGERFFLRFNASYKETVDTPTNKIITSREQLDKFEHYLKSIGLTRADWSYQELLSTDSKDNVSICGWHDADDQNYFATHKILQHPRKLGNGDVCEIIDPPVGLIDMTSNILKALDFAGPFEMEYVYDTKLKKYKIIELNPRLWMQHSLIEKITDYELVRRYIGEKPIKPPDNDTNYVGMRWVNVYYAMFRILMLDIRVFRYLFGVSVKVPPIGICLRWIPRYLLRKAGYGGLK